MSVDVHINQVDLLTQYNQHIGEMNDRLQEACSQVISRLGNVRQSTLTKAWDIKRMEETTAQVLQKYENRYSYLISSYQFGEEDKNLLEQDLTQIRKTAKDLQQRGNQLQQIIKNIDLKITQLEELSKTFSKEMLESLNDTQSALKNHTSNIESYIGGR